MSSLGFPKTYFSGGRYAINKKCIHAEEKYYRAVSTIENEFKSGDMMQSD